MCLEFRLRALIFQWDTRTPCYRLVTALVTRWTEDPDRLQSMHLHGCRRLRQGLVTDWTTTPETQLSGAPSSGHFWQLKEAYSHWRFSTWSPGLLIWKTQGQYLSDVKWLSNSASRNVSFIHSAKIYEVLTMCRALFEALGTHQWINKNTNLSWRADSLLEMGETDVININQSVLDSSICDNMDEPLGHCVKWNKPHTQRKTLYDFTYMWNLTKSNLQKQKAEQVVTRSGRRQAEIWEMWVKEYIFLVLRVPGI